MADYNGWKNRQTWNVALWINNDEFLYEAARSFMSGYANARESRGLDPSYSAYPAFIHSMGMANERTPDCISYSSLCLDYPALNAMMLELIS